MITDKQFNDAFTTAGGWFFLSQFEEILLWTKEKNELVEHMYNKGFDKEKSWTRTRVNCVIRIIENNRAKEALIKIRDSKNINAQHPETFRMATELIKKYYM